MSIELNYFFSGLTVPIRPQAKRLPALPVFFDSSSPPRPKSSGFSWTTKQRPRIECSPLSEINLSFILTVATPFASVWTFPKSPICLKRTESEIQLDY